MLSGIRLLLVGALSLAASAPTPQPAPQDVIPGRYIVSLRPNISAEALESHTAWVQDLHKRNLARRNSADAEEYIGIQKVYDGVFNGYSGGFDDATISEIEASDEVSAVEPDQIWHLYGQQANAPYGLASLSSQNPGATTYYYQNIGGEGSIAYVLDTGIYFGHRDFTGGRFTHFYNAVGGTNEDTNGHGTHVAATIAGQTYGVAKRGRVASVKVFSGNSGTVATVLDGFNTAANHIISTGTQRFALISMSLGGGYSQAFNQAITNAYNQNVLSIVAAGNNGADARNYSPSSTQEAIVVGAYDSNWVRSGSSNFGPTVDIFAAGVDVLSAYIGSPTAAAYLTGTSMACPHVAGLGLYVRSLRAGGFSAAETVYILIAVAHPDRVGNAGAGSLNRAAYTNGQYD